jgi:hypothetical protein
MVEWFSLLSSVLLSILGGGLLGQLADARAPGAKSKAEARDITTAASWQVSGARAALVGARL